MADRVMPSFATSPSALVERFATVMDLYPEAVRRKMFGFPAAFIGGNMATGLFADHWVVRLPEDEIEAAKAAGAGAFEPVSGRPMKAFVIVPQADVADDARIRGWVERGLARARSMPAKG